MKSGIAGFADPLDARIHREAFEQRLYKRQLHLWSLRAIFGVGGLLFWEMSSIYLIDPFWISRPSHILLRLKEWYFTGFFFPHLWITLLEMGVGFFIGLVLAIAAGLFLGTRKTLSDLLDPFMMAIWSVPGIVFGPLFILYFGIGFTAKMVLVAVTVFFLIFFNTFTGVRSVDQEWINVMRIMGASQREIWAKVILPASALWVFASFKNAIPYTMVAAVVGELIASQKGIGYLINDASSVMDTTGVFAALFNLMLIGLILNAVVEHAEKKVLHWKSEGK
ncbi:MAG: ABC transporter permease [Pseudomonadota bacterium]